MSGGKSLLGDESGMAMGLAVILIVVVGVMGAGLLVFVRNDLEAVVQVNQGQEAFEAADAGVQAAKRHLVTASCPESYDGVGTGTPNEDNPCAGSAESDWSYVVEEESGGNGEVGKKLDFDGKEIEVSIRHLPFPSEGGCATSEEECAPEESEGADDEREFFEVESLGKSENGGARRRIKAIYQTNPRAIPETYFATRDIKIDGNASIENTSIFAGGDIEGLRAGTISGDDTVYGSWEDSPWNATARDFLDAGAGAGGEITYSAGGDNAADARAARYGKYDFDSDSTPEFISKEPGDGSQGTDEISFPFNTGAVDDELVNFLCEIANEQGNYRSEEGGGGTVTVDGGDYPSSSDQGTVFCVEFTNNEKGSVNFKAPNRQGTMVVVNGDLELSSSAGTFKGVMVMNDSDPNDEVMVYKDDGNFDLDGYANVEGDMELRGSISPSSSVEMANRPGFHSVELWSWRELYE